MVAEEFLEAVVSWVVAVPLVEEVYQAVLEVEV